MTKIKISKIGIGSSRRVLNDVSNIVKPIALLCRWLAIYFSCVAKYRRHGRSWKRYNCQAEIAQLGERQTEDLKVPGSIPGLGNFEQQFENDIARVSHILSSPDGGNPNWRSGVCMWRFRQLGENGESGYRSRCLSNANRALYHLS